MTAGRIYEIMQSDFFVGLPRQSERRSDVPEQGSAEEGQVHVDAQRRVVSIQRDLNDPASCPFADLRAFNLNPNASSHSCSLDHRNSTIHPMA